MQVEAPLTKTLRDMDNRHYALGTSDMDHAWSQGVFDSIGRVENGQIVLTTHEPVQRDFQALLKRFYSITLVPLSYQIEDGTIKPFEA